MIDDPKDTFGPPIRMEGGPNGYEEMVCGMADMVFGSPKGHLA